MDEHKIEMGTGARAETRAVAEMGTGTGSGRAEERQRSERYRTRVVDAMWETGETWVKREKKRRQESVGSVAADPDNIENCTREARGTQGLSKNCTSRESVSPLSWEDLCC